MSQTGILNRGVYPPGTVVETIQGSNNSVLVAPPISPDASNNIVLNSKNNNLTFSYTAGNVLDLEVSTSPILAYRAVEFTSVLPNPPTVITLTTDDEYIAVQATNSGIIRLPDPATVAQGEQFIVKDTFGLTGPGAGDIKITIDVANGGTIDQQATKVIEGQYNSLRFIKGTAIPNNYEVY